MSESRPSSRQEPGPRPNVAGLRAARARLEADELTLQRAKRRFLAELARERERARRDVA